MKPFALTLFVAALLVGCVNSQSPTGRGQTLLFSDTQMQQMGGQSFEAMKQSEKISQNKAQTDYVNGIAKRSTAVLPEQAQQWDVVVF